MISLRLMAQDDAEQVRQWRTHPDVAQYMYTQPTITPEQQEAWVKKVLVDESRRYWIIEMAGDPVGLANIVDIDRVNHKCSWAFYLADDRTRGRGVGGVVEFAVLEYVFGALKLNKLCCEVLQSNEGVIKLHKSFGFMQEGLARHHVFIEGEPRDVVQLAMLAEDWDSVRSKARTRLERLESRGVTIPVAP